MRVNREGEGGGWGGIRGGGGSFLWRPDRPPRARPPPLSPPFISSCDRGTFLPPRRAPATVVLPSLRMSVAAGACAAAEMKGNSSSLAPTVSCAPFAVAYAYDPPMLLPPRTTPAAAIGPACSLTAALGRGGGDDAAGGGDDAAARTRVIVAPVTVTCPSLAALAQGDCVVGRPPLGGGGGQGQSVEEVMERVQSVLVAALGVE